MEPGRAVGRPWLETGRTSWTAILDAIRLQPGADLAAVTTAQVREVIERLITAGQWNDGDPEILIVMDAGYDAPRIAPKGALVDAMTREFRRGASAMEIWRSVASAFSRDMVKQYLGAVALHDVAKKGLMEAGLDAAVGVSVTGIDAPREARLALTADPLEIPDFATLPQRIREALREFHITLDLPDGEHDEITGKLLDELLLDGEPMRLAKLKPRT